MYCLFEISYYPLIPEYSSEVQKFIDYLQSENRLDMDVSETSTLLRGNYTEVMPLLTEAMRTHLEEKHRSVFVLKVMNAEG